MKKVLLSWLFLIAAIVNAQITLGGTSTTQGQVPIDVNFGYNYTQQIFTQKEIHADGAGNITGLKFYLPATATISNSTNWTVYLGHTTKTAFSSTTDWVALADLTQVYTGAVSHTGGQLEIVFTTAFPYNNMDNLVVAVLEDTPNYTPVSNRFYYYDGVSNNSMYYRSDTTVPNPATPPSATSRTSQKARITFMGLNLSPLPFCAGLNTPTASQMGLPLKTPFTWSAASGATGYRLSIGTSPGASDVINNFDVGNVTDYTLTQAQQLNSLTQYYYRITAYNTAGSATGCSERDFTTTAAAPMNDECANAVALTVNPDLNCTAKTAGNTLGATLSMAAAPCNGNPDDDVWYSFVATSTTHMVTLSDVVATGATSTSTDMYFQVLSGTCGASTSLLCSDPNSGTVTGLTVGQTYYVRVYSYYGTGVNQSFNICIGTPPPPPANDNCSEAINLTVNPDYSCAVTTQGTTVWATASTETAPSCGPSGTNDDVWFKFTATNTSHRITLSNVSGLTDMAMSIASGACGSLVNVQCSDPNTMNVTGLTVGQEYKVRVWTWSSASDITATFEICIGTPPPPPVNDDCSGAINLTVNPDYSCAVTTQGTTVSATASTETAPSCGPSGTNDDVWFKFTATNTSHQITLSNVSNTTDMAMSIASGACGSLVNVKCSDPNIMNVTGLTVGQEYKVRVWTWSSTSDTTATFDICVGTPPPPPANDDCSGAISLTVNPDYACGVSTQGTTVSATASTETAPSCGPSGTNDDVWFKFTATNTSHQITLSNVSNTTDMAMSIVSGACGSLVNVQCSDPNVMNVTGLTVGQEYKVRVWTWSSTVETTATFDICVGTPPPPPANDVCTGAVALTLGNNFASGAVTSTNVGGTTDGTVTCQSASADNVWYSVVVPPSGTLTIETNSATGSSFVDTVLSVHSGTCGNLTNVACDDDSGDDRFSKLSLTGQTPGATLYVSVWRFTTNASNVQGAFKISAYDSSVVLGTGEVKGLKDNIKAYPNPFADVLNISDVTNVKSISVIDISGKLVKTFDKAETALNLNGLNSGMYLVVLNMKDGTRQTIKAIKK